MTKKQIKNTNTLSGREQSLLIISALIMLGTLPFTYVFFLLPLLAIPIALLAILTALGIIRHSTVVRTIEVLSVLGAIAAIWVLCVLLNYFSAN